MNFKGGHCELLRAAQNLGNMVIKFWVTEQADNILIT
jgi:hypothetical protein